MKKKVDGVWMNETPEDEAAIIESLKNLNTETPDPTPTIEDRLAKVEEACSRIRAILLGKEGGK